MITSMVIKDTVTNDEETESKSGSNIKPGTYTATASK